MAYELLEDFKTTPGGAVSVSPAWVIAVLPFSSHVTLDRSRLSTRRSSSVSKSNVETVATDEPVVIGPTGCTNISVVSSKASHTTGLTASLAPDRPYVTIVRPGDWVVAWMVNDEETARTVMERLRTNQPCNRFMDGFKFLGRIGSVRKDWSVSPDGVRSIRYSITANGFTEFDSQILYFPQLARDEIQAGAWLHKLGLFLNEITRGGTIDINTVMPRLLKRLLGDGVGKINGLQDTPNEAYLVPSKVANILGKTRPSTNGVFTYADLLESIMGLQEYPNEHSHDHKQFLPAVTDSGPIYSTSKNMMGRFLPLPPAMDSIPVWSLLGNYLNPAINEMYTTLRANRDGNVVPHFIVRQMPFSTYANEGEVETTDFLDLPRWKLDDTLMVSGNIGTSDAMRFNFVHLMGVSSGDQTDSYKSFVFSPPIWDEADIKRSGLRPYQMTVSCSPVEVTVGPRKWTQHATDFLMGQHLTYTGTFVVLGIQAPICVGDNLEHDGIVYHIESVCHDAGIDPMGHRYFMTTLQVSHGMSSEETIQSAQANGIKQSDLAQYPTLAGKSAVEVATNTISES